MNDTKSMALFCDFENVALGVRESRYKQFDISKVLERLLLKGSIVVKKAYCDWERYREFKNAMHQASFELIEIPHVRMSGKNSADIRMVVDALDLCYTKSHVDTFVIISGDSDFSPLVSKLRENNKTVIGVGVKNSTSDLLIANCDEFIYYDDLVRDEGPAARVPRRRPAARPAASASRAGGPAGAESGGQSGSQARSPSGGRQGGRAGGRAAGPSGGRAAAAAVAGEGVSAEAAVPVVAIADAMSSGPATASADTTSAGAAPASAEPTSSGPSPATVEGDAAAPAAPARRRRTRSTKSVGQADAAPASDDAAAGAAANAGPSGEGLGVASRAPSAAEPGAGEPDAAAAQAAEGADAPAAKPARKASTRRRTGKKAAQAADAEAAESTGVSPAATTPSDAFGEPAQAAEFEPESPAPPPSARAPAPPEEPDDVAERRTLQALDLVVSTLEALETERGEDEKIWGSMVKQTLKRRKPGFNETYYGFRSFNRLLEEARDRGLIELELDDKSGGYTVRSLG